MLLEQVTAPHTPTARTIGLPRSRSGQPGVDVAGEPLAPGPGRLQLDPGSGGPTDVTSHGPPPRPWGRHRTKRLIRTGLEEVPGNSPRTVSGLDRNWVMIEGERNHGGWHGRLLRRSDGNGLRGSSRSRASERSPMRCGSDSIRSATHSGLANRRSNAPFTGVWSVKESSPARAPVARGGTCRAELRPTSKTRATVAASWHLARNDTEDCDHLGPTRLACGLSWYRRMHRLDSM
jgi:hypothetical protein